MFLVHTLYDNIYYRQSLYDADVIESTTNDTEQAERGCDALSTGNLNDEQQAAFDAIMEAVSNNTSTEAKVFRLTAPAGCGKTYLYRALVEEVKRKGGTCVTTAFTGIAASLLPSGETCHRAFGIPVRSRLSGTERSFIERLSPDGDLLESSSLILIDEASMLSKVQAEIIDNLLRVCQK